MREIKESRGFLTRNAQCAGNIGGLNLKRPRPFNKAGLSLRKKRQHGFAFTRMRPLADGDGFRTLKQRASAVSAFSGASVRACAGESAVKFAEESSGNTTFQRA